MRKCKHDGSPYPKGLNYYSVIRTVVEKYEVQASSKEDARLKIESPHTITVIKERITKI